MSAIGSYLCDDRVPAPGIVPYSIQHYLIKLVKVTGNGGCLRTLKRRANEKKCRTFLITLKTSQIRKKKIHPHRQRWKPTQKKNHQHRKSPVNLKNKIQLVKSYRELGVSENAQTPSNLEKMPHFLNPLKNTTNSKKIHPHRQRWKST